MDCVCVSVVELSTFTEARTCKCQYSYGVIIKNVFGNVNQSYLRRLFLFKQEDESHSQRVRIFYLILLR